eukprot:7631285-Lingulodinium_polyedra.AAC.1
METTRRKLRLDAMVATEEHARVCVSAHASKRRGSMHERIGKYEGTYNDIYDLLQNTGSGSTATDLIL